MKVLVALAMASAASSLSIRAPSVQERANNCPKSVKSAWGVDFDVMCGVNQAGWDTYTPGTTNVITSSGDNITDCATQCNAQPGPCRGVVFTISTGTCYFKNSTFAFDSSAATNDNDTNLAIPNANEVASLDTDCPYKNGSTQTSDQGQNFTIHCDQDIVGADYVPDFATEGAGYPYHTNSMGDCLNICSAASPVCQGVAWNPDLTEGYGNCYLKSNMMNPFTFVSRNGNPADNSDSNPSVLQTAVGQFPSINDTCSDGSTVHSANGTAYTLQCNQDQAGNDISSFHATNLNECFTACEQLTTGNCVGVVLDTTLVNGFDNCYLKSAVGTPQENKPGYIFARKGGASSSGKSSSKAWIAGVVVGVIAAIALVAAAVWYFRRRAAAARSPPVNPNMSVAAGGAYAAVPHHGGPPSHSEQGGYHHQDGYNNQGYTADYKHMPGDGAAAAAGGAPMYAHQQHDRDAAPVELEGAAPLPPQELASGQHGGAELPAADGHAATSELASSPVAHRGGVGRESMDDE